MAILKAARPRPRVAIVGNFEKDTLVTFQSLFPTIWFFGHFYNLNVNPAELDLIILGNNISFDIPKGPHILNTGVLRKVHVICFSAHLSFLPGPADNTSIVISTKSTTEEYIIPDLPLRTYSLLENDLTKAKSAKGWPQISLKVDHRFAGSIPDEDQKEKLYNSSIVYDPHTNLPFAVSFQRFDSNLGVAWLPNDFFTQASWVEIICSEWAKTDPDSFPKFGDWTKDKKWMVSEEITLLAEMAKLSTELETITSDYKKRIANLNTKLVETMLAVNNGRRKLITAQGDELLDEAAIAFEELGYKVTKVDDVLEEGAPKREDLRIKDLDNLDWEAIVEVRGYEKSGGTTADLNRLSRFARMYLAETGKEPSKIIYVVNGQISLPPQQRQLPIASSPDDVITFGEQDGLIIWTLDLFKILATNPEKLDIPSVRKSIRDTGGRWPSSA
jgi:hypothetical protein